VQTLLWLVIVQQRDCKSEGRLFLSRKCVGVGYSTRWQFLVPLDRLVITSDPRVPISNQRVISAPLAKKPPAPAPHTSEDEAGANTLKKLRRKSKALLGGSASQNESKKPEMAVAWVSDGKSKVGYDIAPLLSANKVSLLNSLVSKLAKLLPDSGALG
jgi:hypothetical protein